MLLTRKIVIRTISNKENNYSTRQERHKGPEVYTWIALQPVQEPTKNPIPQMNILKQTMLKKL